MWATESDAYPRALEKGAGGFLESNFGIERIEDRGDCFQTLGPDRTRPVQVAVDYHLHLPLASFVNSLR